jgi:hypothetical protein
MNQGYRTSLIRNFVILSAFFARRTDAVFLAAATMHGFFAWLRTTIHKSIFLHRIRSQISSQISRSEHNRIARRDPGFAQPLHAGEKLFLSPGQNVAREYEIHFPEKCRRLFYRKPVAAMRAVNRRLSSPAARAENSRKCWTRILLPEASDPR